MSIKQPVVTIPSSHSAGVPLNVTVANLKSTNKSYSLSGSSQNFAIASTANSVELTSSAGNSAIIYIKWGFGEAETVSASDFDLVLQPGETKQIGYFGKISHVSFIGTSSDDLYVVER